MKNFLNFSDVFGLACCAFLSLTADNIWLRILAFILTIVIGWLHGANFELQRALKTMKELNAFVHETSTKMEEFYAEIRKGQGNRH